MSRANPATTHDNAGIAAWNVKLRAEVRSYEQAVEFVIAGPNALSQIERELGAHMTVVRHGSLYASVRLYDTEIIRYYPDGSFSVSNGGWNTPTTNDRLQLVLPDGYRAYHHQKQLGLIGPGGRWATRAKVQPEGVLWPLDHDVRIKREGS